MIDFITNNEAQMMIDDLGKNEIIKLYDGFNYYRVNEYYKVSELLNIAVKNLKKGMTR